MTAALRRGALALVRHPGVLFTVQRLFVMWVWVHVGLAAALAVGAPYTVGVYLALTTYSAVTMVRAYREVGLPPRPGHEPPNA